MGILNELQERFKANNNRIIGKSVNMETEFSYASLKYLKYGVLK